MQNKVICLKVIVFLFYIKNNTCENSAQTFLLNIYNIVITLIDKDTYMTCVAIIIMGTRTYSYSAKYR